MTPYSFGQKIASNLRAPIVAPNLLLPLAGTAVGAGVGALTSKKNRLRNALIGAGLGQVAGGAAEYALPGLGLGLKYRAEDLALPAPQRDKILGLLPGEIPLQRVKEMIPYMYSRGGNTKGLDMVYSPYSK